MSCHLPIVSSSSELRVNKMWRAELFRDKWDDSFMNSSKNNSSTFSIFDGKPIGEDSNGRSDNERIPGLG